MGLGLFRGKGRNSRAACFRKYGSAVGGNCCLSTLNPSGKEVKHVKGRLVGGSQLRRSGSVRWGPTEGYGSSRKSWTKKSREEAPQTDLILRLPG